MNKLKEADSAAAATRPKLTCGLIMPISAIDGCSAEHWSDVKLIITQCVSDVTEF